MKLVVKVNGRTLYPGDTCILRNCETVVCEYANEEDAILDTGLQKVVSVKWRSKDWDYLYDGGGYHLKDGSWQGIHYPWKDYDIIAILKK